MPYVIESAERVGDVVRIVVVGRRELEIPLVEVREAGRKAGRIAKGRVLSALRRKLREVPREQPSL